MTTGPESEQGGTNPDLLGMIAQERAQQPVQPPQSRTSRVTVTDLESIVAQHRGGTFQPGAQPNQAQIPAQAPPPAAEQSAADKDRSKGKVVGAWLTAAFLGCAALGVGGVLYIRSHTKTNTTRSVADTTPGSMSPHSTVPKSSASQTVNQQPLAPSSATSTMPSSAAVSTANASASVTESASASPSPSASASESTQFTLLPYTVTDIPCQPMAAGEIKNFTTEVDETVVLPGDKKKTQYKITTPGYEAQANGTYTISVCAPASSGALTYLDSYSRGTGANVVQVNRAKLQYEITFAGIGTNGIVTFKRAADGSLKVTPKKVFTPSQLAAEDRAVFGDANGTTTAARAGQIPALTANMAHQIVATLEQQDADQLNTLIDTALEGPVRASAKGEGLDPSHFANLLYTTDRVDLAKLYPAAKASSAYTWNSGATIVGPNTLTMHAPVANSTVPNSSTTTPAASSTPSITETH